MTASLPAATQKWSCTIGELTCKPWRTLGGVCKDAAVFLDDGAAELLHWAGGMKLLPGSVGLYDLHAQLNPVARDFIAAVCTSFGGSWFVNAMELSPILYAGPILPCCHSNHFISPWCC